MNIKSSKPPQSARLQALRSYLDFCKQRDWQRLRRPDAASNDDSRLQTHLLQGVLRHHRWLQTELEARSRVPWRKLQQVVQGILLIAAYELLFLRESQQRSALHEAVELVRLHRLDARAALVNAVLRQLQRDLDAGKVQPSNHSLAVRTSHPDWMVDRWVAEYGLEATTALCEANNYVPQLHLVSWQEDDRQALRQQCEALQLPWTAHPHFPLLTVVARGGGLWQTPVAAEGRFYAQDASSHALVEALGPLLQGRVLDVCSAPGGKGLALARKSEGQLWLNEIASTRLQRLRQNAKRLRQHPPLLQADGTQLPLPDACLDGVLLDVPCSATGTIRKNPDIKWTPDVATLLRQTERQAALLREAARVVRPGGWIAYSTCSLEPEETQLPLAWLDSLRLGPRSWPQLPPAISESQPGFWQLLPSNDWMGFSAWLLYKH